MGIRTTQLIGLNERARDLVRGEPALDHELVGERIYPDGRRESFHERVIGSTVRSEPSGESFEGMFGERHELSRYELPDGRVLCEYVQAEPWSSGPCIFLALRDQRSGEPLAETLWSDQEIDAEL
jgi:hypothetical protein